MADRITIEIVAQDDGTVALKNLSGELVKVGKSAESAEGGLSKTQASLITLNQAIGIARAAWSGFQTVLSAVVKIAETTDSFRRLELSLKAVTGSSSEAALAVEWIKDFARETPLGLQDVSKAFLQLKASGIDPTAGALKGLADAVAATGGTKDQFNRAIQAMAQMAGKGVVSMEELRQQLGEAIPGAVQAMATGLGVDVPTLFAKVSAGAVSAKDGIEALTRAWEMQFGGAAKAQMDTYAGAVDKLGDSWDQFLVALGDTGIYDIVINAIKGVAFAVEGLTAVLRTFFDFRRARMPEEEAANAAMEEMGKAYSKGFGQMEQAVDNYMGNPKVQMFLASSKMEEQKNKEAQALAQSLALVGKELYYAAEATNAYNAEMEMVNAGAPDIVSSLREEWEAVARAIDNATVSIGPFQFKMQDLFGANSAISQGVGKMAQGIADAVGQGSSAGGIAGGLMGVFSWFIGQLVQVVFGGFLSRLQKIFGALGELFEELWAAGLDELVEVLVEIIREFKPLFKMIGQGLRLWNQTFMPLLKGGLQVLRNINHYLKQVGNLLKPLVEAIKNLVKGLGGIGKGVGNAASGLVSGIGGAVSGVGGALGLDTGGQVHSRSGLGIDGMPNHRLIMAAVGERFAMPGQSLAGSGGGVTININDALNGVRVSEMLRAEITRLRATGKL